MEQRTVWEQVFKSYAPLILTVEKSGDEIRVYAKNNGPNIILIKRLILCIEYAQENQTLYIRQGGPLDLLAGGERLEQGATHLKFKISAPDAQRAQAEAEYIDVTGRSMSSVSDFTT